MNSGTWVAFSSEITLVVTAALNLMFQRKSRPNTLSWLSTFGILSAVIFSLFLVFSPQENVLLISTAATTQVLKIFGLFSCWIAVIMTSKSSEIHQEDKSDVLTILLLTTASLSIMVSTTSLLVLFLTFEGMGMGIYLLSSFCRNSAESSEASLKYFFHASLASMLMACGMLLLFAKTGSFDTQVVRVELAKIAQSGNSFYLIVTFTLMVSSLFARMGIFPFQGTLIDTVNGAPTPVSAYILAAKVVASAAFALVLLLELFGIRGETGWTPMEGVRWTEILALVSTAAMVMGNLAALSQQSTKRWFAYFFMAQAAFTFVGLSIANHISVAAMIFMQASVIVSSLGAWFVMQKVTDEAGTDQLIAFDGLAKRSPFACTVLSLVLLSLIGIPPLSGFIGKFFLLGTIVEQKSNWLIAATLLSWIFSAAAGVTVIRRFFLGGTNQEILALSFLDRVVFLLFGLAVFILGIAGDQFMKYLMRSIESVQHFF